MYVALTNTYEILEWNNETPIENIRPDALIYIQNHGIIFPVFVEVHLSNRFDFDKYKDFIRDNDLRAMFGIVPRVIICTDRQVSIPNIGIKFKLIGIDMSGIDTLFK